MSPRRFVLVHAPLVGRSSWHGVAAELEAHGLEVVVPWLHGRGSDEMSFEHLVAVVADSVAGDDVVLVAHSGAGSLLPLAAAAASRTSAVQYVFVDAGVPPTSGRVVLADAAFRRSLEELVDADGLLPPWHTWWGDDLMRRMVPDDELRAAVTADIPRIPLGYFDVVAEVPAGWASAPCGYVLLSEVYRAEADRARAQGWPCVEVGGSHLELVNRPVEVANAILGVASPDREAP